MDISPAHIILLVFIIVILFGGKKIPEVMRGMGEGIRSFKEGMRGDPPAGSQASTQAPPVNTTPVATPDKK